MSAQLSVEQQERQITSAISLPITPRSCWQISDFDFGKVLGRGSFGRVYLAKERRSGYIVSIKCIRKEVIVRQHMEEQLKREIIIQSSLKHPNILPIYGYFTDKKHVMIVLKYCPYNDLWSIIEKRGRLSETLAARIMKSICDAMNYCHSNYVIHRDIKTDNILLDYFNQPQICDFGASIHTNQQRKTCTGTKIFQSPEQILGQPYDKRVDVWALGIVCYELLYGKNPFENLDDEKTKKAILNVDIHYPPIVSLSAIQFMKRFLVANREQRISLDQVPNDPWIKMYAH